MIVAKWKSGFERIYKADAQTVAEEIMAIGPSATPEEIVEAGRVKDSELHKCFEWDNDIAAEKFRLHQARLIVGNLVITREEAQKDEPEIRFFHVVNRNEGYKPTHIIIKNEDEYTQLLKQAYAELQVFKRKYSTLEELREILDLIP